jgi:hypothetical protein
MGNEFMTTEKDIDYKEHWNKVYSKSELNKLGNVI